MTYREEDKVAALEAEVEELKKKNAELSSAVRQPYHKNTVFPYNTNCLICNTTLFAKRYYDSNCMAVKIVNYEWRFDPMSPHPRLAQAYMLVRCSSWKNTPAYVNKGWIRRTYKMAFAP